MGSNKDKETDDAEDVKQDSDDVTRKIPSFAQKRLWFLDKLTGPSPVYNIRRLLKLTGHLNIEALRSSLNTIFRRHDEPLCKNGFVELTDKPGLGLELDPDVMKAHLVDGETWWG